VEGKDSGLSRKLGKAFAAREGRRFGSEGFYLQRLPKHKNATRWKVQVTPHDETQGVSLVSTHNANLGTNGLATTKLQNKKLIGAIAEQPHQTNQTNRRLTEEEARKVQELISEGMAPASARAEVLHEGGGDA
jgi:hypothetical protein